MIRTVWIAATLIGAGLVAGCNQPMPGSSLPLGQVDYTSAFAAGKEVMSQYYSVESANPHTGVITSRPKAVDAERERILGGSPARELATLRLQEEGSQVVAYATVALQRQGSSVLRQPRPGLESYDTVPNQTPAEDEAATTIEQNESWRTHSYSHSTERKMLQDLRRAVSPKPKE